MDVATDLIARNRSGVKTELKSVCNKNVMNFVWSMEERVGGDQRGRAPVTPALPDKEKATRQ